MEEQVSIVKRELEEQVNNVKRELEDSSDPAVKKLRMENESPRITSSVLADGAAVESDPCVKAEGSTEMDGSEQAEGAAEDESPSCAKPKNRIIHIGYQPERAVGITQYLGNQEGFSGILKHRYSDFVVNEITEEMEIVRLTDFNIPEEVSSEPVVAPPSEVMPEDILKKVERLSQRITILDVEIKVTHLDKEARTKLHECLRYNYTNLKSFTKKVGVDNFVVIQYNKLGNERRGRWPGSRGNYTHFVLYKENIDTMEAIRTIASCLNMNPNAYTFAGTKDKRGKTCQRVSVQRVEAQKLLKLNSFLKNIKIGNVSYKKTALSLGDLFGNRFVVVIREITKTASEIDDILSHFAQHGFINYFGLQRFGSSSIPTHDIGRCLVLQDWKKAVELVLEPRGNSEARDLQEARRIWWETRDACHALRVLHKKNSSIEAILLKALASHTAKDYLNALNRIPRNTRLLYLHSYQSYIWNYIVSLRIAKYRLDPIEGDLILPTKDNQKQTEEVEQDEESKVPVVLTRELLDAGDVSIYDVVLPLPGHSIIYPNNEVSEWYEKALAKDGLTVDSFKPKVKEYSLGGCYRHMLVKAENTSWDVLNYNDNSTDLVISDYDTLQSVQCPKTEGEKRALKLDLSLPSSCYATMAVREILKKQTNDMIIKPE